MDKNNIIKQRFKDVYYDLLYHRNVKNKSEFASKIQSHAFIINEMLHKDRAIGVRVIQNLCKEFNVNSAYIFGQSDIMYIIPNDIAKKIINILKQVDHE